MNGNEDFFKKNQSWEFSELYNSILILEYLIVAYFFKKGLSYRSGLKGLKGRFRNREIGCFMGRTWKICSIAGLEKFRKKLGGLQKEQHCFLFTTNSEQIICVKMVSEKQQSHRTAQFDRQGGWPKIKLNAKNQSWPATMAEPEKTNLIRL